MVMSDWVSDQSEFFVRNKCVKIVKQRSHLFAKLPQLDNMKSVPTSLYYCIAPKITHLLGTVSSLAVSSDIRCCTQNMIIKTFEKIAGVDIQQEGL